MIEASMLAVSVASRDAGAAAWHYASQRTCLAFADRTCTPLDVFQSITATCIYFYVYLAQRMLEERNWMHGESNTVEHGVADCGQRTAIEIIRYRVNATNQ